LRGNVNESETLLSVICCRVRCREITYTARSRCPRPGHWRCCLTQHKKKKIRDTIPLHYYLLSVPLPPRWSYPSIASSFWTLSFWVRITALTDSRLLDAPPNTSLLLLVSAYYFFLLPSSLFNLSYVAALSASTLIYLDRLCYGILIGTLYFLSGDAM
jgi:hypothetical protein